jgi:two-component system, response regulator PdtaR
MVAQVAKADPLVLVVEDEAFVRMIATEYLEDAGFNVVEAANADEAWRVLQDRVIEYLFTDVHMPGSMDGFALAARAHRQWPHLKLVLTSGLMRPGKADLPDHASFLPKPYRQEQLMNALQASQHPA